MSAANKALVRRFIEEVFNKKNLALIDEFAGDFVLHSPYLPARSPADVRQNTAMLHGAFPDFHITVEDLVAEEEKVVARMTIRGTHKGDFMGIAATGKAVTMPGVFIYRIVNGKFQESWANVDFLGLMQQLGVVPPLGQGKK